MEPTGMDPSKIGGWLEGLGKKIKFGEIKLTPDQKKMAEDFIFSVQSSLKKKNNQEVEK